MSSVPVCQKIRATRYGFLKSPPPVAARPIAQMTTTAATMANRASRRRSRENSHMRDAIVAHGRAASALARAARRGKVGDQRCERGRAARGPGRKRSRPTTTRNGACRFTTSGGSSSSSSLKAARPRGLLADPGIVRNRLKIEGAVKNAQAFIALRAEPGGADGFLWQFVGGRPRKNAWTSARQVPARTVESDAMSKALVRRGFTFVGSTICYAFMQAVGMVNDHTTDCFRYRLK